ncbi:hypothetical protein F7725_012774 [Dissostichus mawsoni]|uniref:Uncharacterized protein n=1 Tax=Dissostichus mawsoni TaxID=36200 RepID=A0A7J5YN82_DISMA|nr:hypothetical protein F7725_012774 [Dissostichus mawsoni]
MLKSDTIIGLDLWSERARDTGAGERSGLWADSRSVRRKRKMWMDETAG